MLIDVTPLLTNDAFPHPYKLTYESKYNYGLKAYCAFNDSSEDTWVSEAGLEDISKAWICLDIGKEIKIDKIVSDHTCKYGQTPKKFTIHYSNDGEKFYEFKTISIENELNLNDSITFNVKNLKCRFIKFIAIEKFDDPKNDKLGITFGKLRFYIQNLENLKSSIPKYYSNEGLLHKITGGGYSFNTQNLYSIFSYYNYANISFSVNNSYVLLDAGEVIKLSLIAMTERYNSSLDCMVKDFEIYGSMDGENYSLLKKVYGSELSYLYGETRRFVLDKTYTIRYFKIVSLSSYDKNNRVANFGKISLLYDDSKNNQIVNHRYAYQNTTLPMNSIDKILSKTNDSREGLLGMANNDENYGELYVVGKDGKSHLIKGGIKSEKLWSGQIIDGTIAPLKNIMDFNCIIIGFLNELNKISSISIYLTKDVKSSKNFSLNIKNGENTVISINEDNSLSIINSKITIVSIIGVY